MCAQGLPIRSIPTPLILAGYCETESHWVLHSFGPTFASFITKTAAPSRAKMTPLLKSKNIALHSLILSRHNVFLEDQTRAGRGYQGRYQSGINRTMIVVLVVVVAHSSIVVVVLTVLAVVVVAGY